MAMRFADFDFLVKEMTERVAERLADIRRSFERTLVLGCHTGQVTAGLPRAQLGDVVQADLSPDMVEQARDARPALALDEERLPFGFDCFDLVIAVGNLHWVNDLPGTLIQIRYALKPDGLLLAAMPGGRTLHELRACLAEAEAQVNEVTVPRVAPFIDVPDAGDLLRRTGYALPVADIDTLTVTYAHPLKLLQDLRGMAEGNALIESARQPLRRSTLAEACRLYQERYADGRGRIPATFQLLMLAAWCPGPGQPKPLKRGSGEASLAAALTNLK